MKAKLGIVWIIGLATACGESLPSESGPVPSLAVVRSLEIRMLETFPLQVQVVARGELPDPCTRIDEVEQSRHGFDIEVRMTTSRPPRIACIQIVAPFENVIPIEVLGLPAGTYEVRVNGVRGSFVVPVDNSPPR